MDLFPSLKMLIKNRLSIFLSCVSIDDDDGCNSVETIINQIETFFFLTRTIIFVIFSLAQPFLTPFLYRTVIFDSFFLTRTNIFDSFSLSHSHFWLFLIAKSFLALFSHSQSFSSFSLSHSHFWLFLWLAKSFLALFSVSILVFYSHLQSFSH